MKILLFFIVLAAAATLYALYMVVAPFLEDRSAQLRRELVDQEFHRLEELAARKSVLLQTLRDLESDWQTGKLAEDDYRNMKKKYERQAVEITREIDDLRTGMDVDDEIEALIDEKLETDRQVDDQSNASSSAPGELTCSECGADLEPEDRFCSRCGQRVEPDEDAEETGSETSESTSTSGKPAESAPDSADDDEDTDDLQSDEAAAVDGSEASGDETPAAEVGDDEEIDKMDLRSEATG